MTLKSFAYSSIRALSWSLILVLPLGEASSHVGEGLLSVWTDQHRKGVRAASDYISELEKDP